MKSLIIGAALAALTLGAAQTASAAGDAPAKQRAICLNSMQIDHTEIRDNKTILFYMHGGKVWKNTLTSPCPGLRFDGFAYSPVPNGDICENVQIIKALNSGSVCSLGAFEPYTRPKKTTEQ